MANSQTVIFRISDGFIVKSLRGRYIRSRLDFARLINPLDAAAHSFIYFHSLYPLDPARHRVHPEDHLGPRRIVSLSGAPLVWPDKLLSFRHAVDAGHAVILDFADSMGDNIIRASVALAAQAAFPGVRFFCKIEPQYRPVMELCDGITLFDSYEAHDLFPSRCTTLRLNGGHLFDPRGDGFPKSCLYGLMLGLDFVPYVTRLRLPPDAAARTDALLSMLGLDSSKPLFILHPRSKGWDFRDWPLGHAAALANLLNRSFDCSVAALGASSDGEINLPGCTDLAGRLSWLDTLLLLSHAAAIFCIDSAPMHLSRALLLNYFCIWGGTHPLRITGEIDRHRDLISSDTPGNHPMAAITPEAVFRRAFPDSTFPSLRSAAPIRDYSQSGSQGIIFRYFTRHAPVHRVLVDVGAYGLEMSNTFGLLQSGWRGVMIDAHPDRCTQMTSDFSGLDVSIVNAAIADRRGSAAFHLHTAPGHESLLSDWLPETLSGASIPVHTQLLAPLLRAHRVPADFDLLSIDTEGFDFRILRQFLSSSKYRPRLIVCENSSFDDPLAFFSSFGYSLFHDSGPADGSNLFFCHNS